MKKPSNSPFALASLHALAPWSPRAFESQLIRAIGAGASSSLLVGSKQLQEQITRVICLRLRHATDRSRALAARNGFYSSVSGCRIIVSRKPTCTCGKRRQLFVGV